MNFDYETETYTTFTSIRILVGTQEGIAIYCENHAADDVMYSERLEQRDEIKKIYRWPTYNLL